jgi:hypothetical protein
MTELKPLEWTTFGKQCLRSERRWFADADVGVYSVADPTGTDRWMWQWHLHVSGMGWGALLAESDQVLANAFATRGDAVAAVEGHRKARILSALEPQPDASAQLTDALSDLAAGQRRLGAEFEDALAANRAELYGDGPLPPAPDAAAILEVALQKIAAQKKTTELDTEYEVECADFEGAYDAIIDVARAALTRRETK